MLAQTQQYQPAQVQPPDAPQNGTPAPEQPSQTQPQQTSLRLRQDPPPVTQPTRSRKRKSPPDANQQAQQQPLPPPPIPQPMQHSLPPPHPHPHALPPMQHGMPPPHLAGLPPGYPYPPPDYPGAGLPPPPMHGVPPPPQQQMQQPGDQQQQQQQQESPSGSSRTLSQSKRAEQNRKAQRAFRERRDQHVKALESRSQLLDAALASADEANRRWEECRALVDQLRIENAALRAALSQAQIMGAPPSAPTVAPTQPMEEQPSAAPPGETAEENRE